MKVKKLFLYSSVTGIKSRTTLNKLRTFCNDVAVVALLVNPITFQHGTYAVDESVFIRRKVSPRNMKSLSLIYDFLWHRVIIDKTYLFVN